MTTITSPAELSTEPNQPFNIELWSPQFRSNEPETYEVFAPNRAMAIAQAIFVSFTGEPLQADDLPTESDPNGNIDLLTQLPELQLEVKIDGVNVDNFIQLIHSEFNISYGVAL